MTAFRLSPSLTVSLAHVGSEREPVLTIDGVLRDPQALVDYAATQVAFDPAWTADGGYPGMKAAAPLDYVEMLVRSLAPIVEEAFALSAVKLARADCTFSLVTLAPDALAPLQRIPHVDTVDPLRFAVLHYLCDEGFGGTAFYRHRATGFETLTEERRPIYERVREGELAARAENAGYIIGETADYVQTGAARARFDRVIVYRSRLLHSGQILAPERLSADPRAGRLTSNIFVTYRQA